MAQGGSTMNNKHVRTEIREDDVATVTPNRAEVHHAFVAEPLMTVTGKVMRRVPCQQVPEDALLRRNPG
jgi:hypothetical protein